MQRSRDYIRHMCWTKAIRKKKISDNLCGEWFPHLHQYSKNKIHCSCLLCANKTNDKRIHGRSKNYKASDLRKLSSFDFQIRDFFF